MTATHYRLRIHGEERPPDEPPPIDPAFPLELTRGDSTLVAAAKGETRPKLCIPASWIQDADRISSEPWPTTHGPNVPSARVLGLRLGQRLFDLYRHELWSRLGQATVHVELEIDDPRAASLPWEALGYGEPEALEEALFPFLSGAWSLRRRLRCAPRRERRERFGARILFVLGNTASWDDSQVALALRTELDELRALAREKGLACTLRLVGGRASLTAGTRQELLHVDQVLHGIDGLGAEIRSFAPDIVHFLGHGVMRSEERGAGHEWIQLECADAEGKPQSVSLDPRSEKGGRVLRALRDVGCTLALFDVCAAREALAGEFLRSGAARVVIGTTALTYPELCAEATPSFYRALFGLPSRNPLDALTEVRRALHTSLRWKELAWIPALWIGEDA